MERGGGGEMREALCSVYSLLKICPALAPPPPSARGEGRRRGRERLFVQFTAN